MKRINYIVIIALLIIVELFSFLYFYILDELGVYFNNPIIPIVILSLIILVAYFVFCKKSISSDNGKMKIEKILIIIISVITVLKVLTLIPIVTLKRKIIEPMEEINKNYTSYSNFEDLYKVANITQNTDFDISSTPIQIPYFGYMRTANYVGNLFLGTTIRDAANNYNNSYSNFVKSTQKYNAVYSESWMDSANNFIEDIQKSTISLAIFSILYEMLIISIPIIMRKMC